MHLFFFPTPVSPFLKKECGFQGTFHDCQPDGEDEHHPTLTFLSLGKRAGDVGHHQEKLGEPAEVGREMLPQHMGPMATKRAQHEELGPVPHLHTHPYGDSSSPPI